MLRENNDWDFTMGGIRLSFLERRGWGQVRTLRSNTLVRGLGRDPLSVEVSRWSGWVVADTTTTGWVGSCPSQVPGPAKMSMHGAIAEDLGNLLRASPHLRASSCVALSVSSQLQTDPALHQLGLGFLLLVE